MLNHVEMDPHFSLQQQFADTSSEPTILVNLFDVATEDVKEFKSAWNADAAFFKVQPGYISAQLHQGIQGSHLFLNYAVFENTAAFAATTKQPEFGPLRAVYPDSATAHPHLFRRVAIPGICVGEAKGQAGTRAKEPTTGLQHEELDPHVSLQTQFADALDEPVILIGLSLKQVGPQW